MEPFKEFEAEPEEKNEKTKKSKKSKKKREECSLPDKTSSSVDIAETEFYKSVLDNIYTMLEKESDYSGPDVPSDIPPDCDVYKHVMRYQRCAREITREIKSLQGKNPASQKDVECQYLSSLVEKLSVVTSKEKVPEKVKIPKIPKELEGSKSSLKKHRKTITSVIDKVKQLQEESKERPMEETEPSTSTVAQPTSRESDHSDNDNQIEAVRASASSRESFLEDLAPPPIALPTPNDDELPTYAEVFRTTQTGLDHGRPHSAMPDHNQYRPPIIQPSQILETPYHYDPRHSQPHQMPHPQNYWQPSQHQQGIHGQFQSHPQQHQQNQHQQQTSGITPQYVADLEEQVLQLTCRVSQLEAELQTSQRQLIVQAYTQPEALQKLSSQISNEGKGVAKVPERTGTKTSTEYVANYDSAVVASDFNPEICPSKLAMRLRKIYDEKWDDVMTYKKTVLKKTERKSAAEIVDVLRTIYTICKRVSDEQINAWHHMIRHSTNENLPPYLRYVDTADNIRIQLKNVQQSMAEEYTDFTRKMVLSNEMFSTIFKAELDTCRDFVLACIDICWLMSMHEPHVHLNFNADPESSVNRNNFDVKEETGNIVDYLLWPAVFSRENGELLAKGIVKT